MIENKDKPEIKYEYVKIVFNLSICNKVQIKTITVLPIDFDTDQFKAELENDNKMFYWTYSIGNSMTTLCLNKSDINYIKIEHIIGYEKKKGVEEK